ncbi:hypothetical protein [Chlorobium ferrooxidans]|nr:hypothetical protein [Chlorobium ferrooxidans]
MGDRIDLSTLDANSATAKNDAFSFIGGMSFNSIDASGQLCYDAVSGMLYGSTDSDIDPEFVIQLINISNLVTRDFIL